MVKSLQDAPNWDDITEEWTEQEYARAFAEVVQTYVATKWLRWTLRTPGVDLNDLESIALEHLVMAAREWPAWAATHDGGVESRAKFWSYARRRINFRILDHQRRVIGRSPSARLANAAFSIDDIHDDQAAHLTPAATMFAQATAAASAAREPSMLQVELVAAFRSLPRVEQLVLNLEVHDELSRDASAAVLGIRIERARAIYLRAAQKLQHAARSLVNEEVEAAEHTRTPYLDSPDLIDWCRRTHHTTPDGYLSLCADAYSEDPTLLAELIITTRATLDRTESNAQARTRKKVAA